MKHSNLRELGNLEIEQVNGGIHPAVVIGVGAAGGAVAGYQSGGWRGALTGAALGAASAASGVMMAVTSGFVRAGWAIRSIGLTGTSGALGDELTAKGGSSQQPN